jgi:hypothetical protein
MWKNVEAMYMAMLVVTIIEVFTGNAKFLHDSHQYLSKARKPDGF